MNQATNTLAKMDPDLKYRVGVFSSLVILYLAKDSRSLLSCCSRVKQGVLLSQVWNFQHGHSLEED